jgi:tetratricopeptide (TPR) repeat protein
MTRARLQGESESSAQQHDGDIQDAEKEEKLWLLELELLTSHIHDYVRAIKLLDDVILPLHHSGARPLSQRARQTLYYMSFHCGKQLLQSSDWTQAREWFHRARRLVVDHATEERCHIDHHPQPPPGIAEAQAACMLAFCSVKLGDAARAITLAKEALALDSSIAAARVVLFEAFLLAGNEFEIEGACVRVCLPACLPGRYCTRTTTTTPLRLLTD